MGVLVNQRNSFGPNMLPEAVPRSEWSLLLNQFISLPVALLAASAGISFFTGGMIDAVVILGVVAINFSPIEATKRLRGASTEGTTPMAEDLRWEVADEAALWRERHGDARTEVNNGERKYHPS